MVHHEREKIASFSSLLRTPDCLTSCESLWEDKDKKEWKQISTKVFVHRKKKAQTLKKNDDERPEEEEISESFAIKRSEERNKME